MAMDLREWPSVRFEPLDTHGKPVRWVRITERLIKAHGLEGRVAMVRGGLLRGERVVVFADKEAAVTFLMFAPALGAEVSQTPYNLIWLSLMQTTWPWA